MQYKDNTKMIIDKRKLEILLRLGCPDEQLLQLIKTGTFTKTGDKLIDDTLECLIDVRDFENWGGAREGAGRKKKNQDENQLEIQDDNHLANQDAFQVVDKDIDIDIENNNSIKERGLRGKPLKEEETEKFEQFWKYYTPVKSKEGHFVAKGNKQACLKKFINILNEGVNYETIINGLEKYLTYCRNNGYSSCGAEVFLNQRRFENDYSDSECVDSKANNIQRRPVSIVEIAAELTKESKYDDTNCVPF